MVEFNICLKNISYIFAQMHELMQICMFIQTQKGTESSCYENTLGTREKKVACMKMPTQSNRFNLKFSSLKYIFSEMQKIIVKILHC